MIILLLASALLVLLPILAIQYQRYLDSLPDLDYSTPSHTTSSTFHPRENTGYDGAASDSASEGPSDPRPLRASTVAMEYERRGSRKPWDPPFPTSAKTIRPSYMVLPSIDTQNENMNEKGNGKERERRSTSQIPAEDLQEDACFRAQLGHLPVTDPPFCSPTLPPPSPLHFEKVVQQEQTVSVQKDAQVPAQPAPEPTPAAAQRKSSLSIVQTIVLVLAFIIFVFAFAILVAHCMAWFVVYKTEARLGDVRKGLLRGGDMRVCLCAR